MSVFATGRVNVFNFALTVACMKPWKSFNGHCYYFSDDNANWSQARDFCRQKHGSATLVVIDRKPEQDFITSKNTSIIYI